MIGHRGASSIAPENTVPAMRAAVEARADGVEFDVRLTADGHPVVVHDDEVERTTGAAGVVSAMTLAEVRALEVIAAAGHAGTRVPTLDEVLEVVAGRMLVILELKGRLRADGSWGAAEVLDAVAARIRSVPELIVTSFDPVVLVAAHDVLPGVPTALAGYRTEDDWLVRAAAADGHRAVSIPAAQADEAYVRACHDARVEVYAWDAPADDARALASMGVDVIITADPARARAVLG